MTLGRTSAIVLIGCMCSISVLLLLLCQLGIFGSSKNDRPTMLHNDLVSTTSSSCSDGLPECNLGVGSRYACKTFNRTKRHMPLQRWTSPQSTMKDSRLMYELSKISRLEQPALLLSVRLRKRRQSMHKILTDQCWLLRSKQTRL